MVIMMIGAVVARRIIVPTSLTLARKEGPINDIPLAKPNDVQVTDLYICLFYSGFQYQPWRMRFAEAKLD
jgi:hypothetical protein